MISFRGTNISVSTGINSITVSLSFDDEYVAPEGALHETVDHVVREPLSYTIDGASGGYILTSE